MGFQPMPRTITRMHLVDLGTMPYREAWAAQERAHAEVVAGGEEQLLFVQHPPVITFGRRPDIGRNVIASDESLKQLGVEVVHSDRGGDVTFHGPGQLVVYPIIRLIDHRLSVGGYVRALEFAVIDALRTFDVPAQKDVCAVGVWTEDPPGSGTLAKICAIGVRVRRGVTLHGLALNVTTDLSYFDLIIPCGLTGRPVTSLQKLLGRGTPDLPAVKSAIIGALCTTLRHGVSPADAPIRHKCPPPAAATRSARAPG
jgi:lipoyl(octanoyl) transferase